MRPGDTVIVPAQYGGCDAFGWNPNWRDPVTDLGVRAHYLQRQKGAIRITRATLENALAYSVRAEQRDPRSVWADVERVFADDGDPEAETVRKRLLEIRGLPDAWRRLLNGMSGRRVAIAPYRQDDCAAGVIVYAEGLLDSARLDEAGGRRQESGDEAVPDRLDFFFDGGRGRTFGASETRRRQRSAICPTRGP